MTEPNKQPERDDSRMSSEDYEQLLDRYEYSTKEITMGKLLKGRVIKRTPTHVLVDVGFKKEGAISRAERAFASETDPQRRSYALLIQAMAAEESGNTTKASAVYAQWGQFDPARADPAEARNQALDGLLKLQRIRQDTGLPPLCT